ncbi:Plasma membrane low glucose sensor [Thoreauomyces humboldtii]|nr:Plasma membrane low glucose sensor [Thoreauomyces humboldtii]
MANVNAISILICIFVSFGGFLYGYDTGLISGIQEMSAFINDFGPGGGQPLKSSVRSVIVSILSIGTFFGALTAGYLADRVGRRYAIMVSCCVFSVGVALQTASHSLGLLLPGRVVAGFGVGLLSDLIPLYQAEAAPKHLRGTLVSTYQLAITIGILAAFGVNQGCQNISGRTSYRVPIALQFVFAAVLFFGMIVLPESPRYLLKEGRPEQARSALSRLRGRPPQDTVIVDEMVELEEALAFEASLGVNEATYADCFRGNSNRRTQIGIWIQCFQQLTGVNAIFYFGPTFFRQAGISQAYLTSTITGVVNVVSTFPALYLVERIGRRQLLLMGSAIMFIGQIVVASIGTAYPAKLDNTTGAVISANGPAGVALIVFTCIFIYGFASSWGPGAWVVTTEVFPIRIRSKGVSLSTASNWFWNFILAFCTPYVVDHDKGNLGPKISFIWAFFVFVGGVFVYFFVPETKGLALEDVDELFDSGIPARHSAGYIVKGRHSHSELPQNALGYADKNNTNMHQSEATVR